MMNYFDYCNCGMEGCPYSWVLGIGWTGMHSPEGDLIVVGQIHFVSQINFFWKVPATIKPVLGSVILEVRCKKCDGILELRCNFH